MKIHKEIEKLKTDLWNNLKENDEIWVKIYQLLDNLPDNEKGNIISIISKEAIKIFEKSEIAKRANEYLELVKEISKEEAEERMKKEKFLYK